MTYVETGASRKHAKLIHTSNYCGIRIKNKKSSDDIKIKHSYKLKTKHVGLLYSSFISKENSTLMSNVDKIN